MTFQFPPNPSVGQQVGGPNGFTYQWDGRGWVTLGGGGEAFPEAPDDGRTYGRNGQAEDWNAVLPLTGGELSGDLDIRREGTPASLRFISDARTWGLTAMPAGSLVLVDQGNGTTPISWAAGPAVDTTFVQQLQLYDPTAGVSRIYFGQLLTNAFLLELNQTAGILSMVAPTGQMFQSGFTGTFTIYGQGYKPGGGEWADSTSDARAKTVEGDYASGLAAIEQLRPVVYTFKGNDTGEDGGDSPHKAVADAKTKFIGLVAQDAEGAMPEMVMKRRGKIDGQDVDDLRAMDTSPLVYALVNAVKELSGQVAALRRARA